MCLEANLDDDLKHCGGDFKQLGVMLPLWISFLGGECNQLFDILYEQSKKVSVEQKKEIMNKIKKLRFYS